ncbi:MAG TPA: diphthine--ammonia ligase [Tissierellia bacterium]|nr:diphthine--ammonia ligase [Tissierellia bacterium]
MQKNCFVSWSGGKDSCLALYKAMELGYNPVKLFTMFGLEDISSSHRLNEKVIKSQAKSIGIDYIIGKASFNEYEKVFVSNLRIFKEEGINYGIFGDIDLYEHRQWEEKVCDKASMEAVLPLWNRDRKEIVKEFIKLGFKAKIVVVNTKMLDTKFLGQDLSIPLLEEIEKNGADPCGENGEYHTVVYDGPIFKNPVDIEFDYTVIPIEDTWAQIKVQ